MFIELAEFLRCPARHGERSYCVVLPDRMEGRRIVRGSVACPECGRDFPIVGGVVRFDPPGGAPAGRGEAGQRLAPANVSAVPPLLALAGPGGYVVLLGSVARHVDALARDIEGVHFVGVNAPSDVAPSGALSLLTAADRIPLQSAMARGCVVSRECALEPWLGEAARLLLPGLRLVVFREDVVTPGVEQLAKGDGMWVGARP
ncbi:MAG: Trm112 family protein [Gemmatimonadota bacterium]|nr:MAG: Trm112 family protein [Gemmatimonadota bacterium]